MFSYGTPCSSYQSIIKILCVMVCVLCFFGLHTRPALVGDGTAVLILADTNVADKTCSRPRHGVWDIQRRQRTEPTTCWGLNVVISIMLYDVGMGSSRSTCNSEGLAFISKIIHSASGKRYHVVQKLVELLDFMQMSQMYFFFSLETARLQPHLLCQLCTRLAFASS